jgi:type VI secretion system protein
MHGISLIGRCVGTLTLLASLNGCALMPKFPKLSIPGWSVRPHNFSVQVNVAASANENSPVPLDFVAVLDKKLMAEVSKLSAKDWWARRSQIQRDFPGKVEVVSWEWVPGQTTGPISVAVSPKARMGYFFAHYNNGGDHRAVVSLRWPVVVNLGPSDFSVLPLR